MKILILLFFTSSFAFASKSCLEVRAAFDIGSGATKMKVAQVDVCQKKIIKELLVTDKPVEYKECFKECTPDDLKLNNAVKEKGLLALAALKKEAQAFHPVSYIAVATSAFRSARNAEEFTHEIYEKLEIPVYIISQEQEAILGFTAAQSKLGLSREEVVVWDIGGGSMQITSYSTQKDYSIYEGFVAAVSFKDMIISDIQKKDYKKITSPNPLQKNGAREAVQLAQREASHVLQDIKNKIEDGATVIGIGGVHYTSIREQINNKTNVFTAKELERKLKKNSVLTDAQIGGNYTATQVSNLALVLGFMKELKIPKVVSAQINMADGVLIAPELIESKE